MTRRGKIIHQDVYRIIRLIRSKTIQGKPRQAYFFSIRDNDDISLTILTVDQLKSMYNEYKKIENEDWL